MWELPDDILDEIQRLVDAQANPGLTDAQCRRLEQLLMSDPVAADFYLQYVAQTASLCQWAGAAREADGADGEQPAALEDDEAIDDAMVLRGGETMILPAVQPGDVPDEPEPMDPPPTLPDWKAARARSAKLRRRIYGGIAAAVLLTVSLSIIFLRSDSAGPVARLTSTRDAQWASDVPLNPGESIEGNRRLVLQSGVAELTFASGARVVLEGPAVFVPTDKNRGSLTTGRLVAHVPPRAKGFTVASPGPVVKDLGTEFGLYVTTTGSAEVHVFVGAVDVELAPPPAASAGTPRKTVRLVRDEAIRCPPAGGTPVQIAATPQAFVESTTALAVAPESQPATSRPADVLAGLNGRWTFDGTLDNATGGAGGTFIGGPTPPYVPGPTQGVRALQLAGNDEQYVHLPYSSRDQAAITVSIWVRPSSTANQNVMVFSNPEGPRHRFSNQLWINNGRFALYAWDGQPHVVTGTTAVVPGRWYLITGTVVSDDKLRLYVNGVAEGGTTDIGAIEAHGDRYLIGVKSARAASPINVSLDAFAGLVADARVYHRALSPGEVSALFAVKGGAEVH